MVDQTTLIIVGSFIVASVVVAKLVFGSKADSSYASGNNDDNEQIEQVVGKKSELAEGDMKECKVEGQNVLLVKHKGNVHAIGARCTHLGAPLKNGVVANGHVRCPWHGACFSVETGDIEEFPCSDALQRFELKPGADDDELVLCATRGELKVKKREPPAVAADKNDKRLVVIVGAGAAGGTCAEGLRQEGYTGRIMMIGNEAYLPYDRTKLSKALSSDAAKLQLRTTAFYRKLNVELKLKTTVTAFDAKEKSLTMKNNESDEEINVEFDYALLCTGGTPRSLPIPGFDANNVYQLRDPHHAHGIAASLTKESDVVIIGSSFIGMEAAASVVSKSRSVVVVGMESVPFERVLGKEVGAALQSLHESKGVKFEMNRTVKKIETDDENNVIGVVMDNDVRLSASVCIVGAGVIPTTKFVEGVEKGRDQSIMCDESLLATKDVYAAGDIARFPYAPVNDTVRIEHYGYAMTQGRLVATNIAKKSGKKEKLNAVPFFWTTQYGKHIRYAGHAIGYNQILIDGDVDSLNFVAVYARDEKVLAVAAMSRDKQASAAAELLSVDAMPKASAWNDSKAKPDLVQLLTKLK